MALQGSSVIGNAVGIGLLIFYFTQASWYWPVVLFMIGLLAGGAVFGLLDVLAERLACKIFKIDGMGQLIMNTIGFIVWPLSAIWSFFVMRGVS